MPTLHTPLFGCVYGPSKFGKTTDALYSFPRGMFLAQPGALLPATWIGFEPKAKLVNTIEEATAFLRRVQVPADLPPAYFPVVVIDDFSLLSDATFSALEKRLSGFKLWGALRDDILDLRHVARQARVHVIWNAHEGAPRVVSGQGIRGGPKLPGTLPEAMPSACDFVLRAQVASEEERPWGHRGCYRLGGGDYIAGDRTGIAYDGCPMNLGELMRAAGYSLPRLWDWQENAVAASAAAFHFALAGGDATRMDQQIEATIEGLTRAGRSEAQINWTLRDALDRATIRLYREHHKHNGFRRLPTGSSRGSNSGESRTTRSSDT